MKQLIFFSFWLILTCPLSAVTPPSTDKEIALVQHVEKCLARAEQELSKLDSGVLSIHGMSSPKVRHLLNNLCTLPQCTYLEVGSWKGSTLVGALYRNEAFIKEAIAIENWSEFGSPRDDCFSNIRRFIPYASLRVIEYDCFYIDPLLSIPNPVNIYFYDGGHDFTSQEKAFTFFNPVFDDVFIAIVDDWNWVPVRNGTYSAFKALNYTVLFERNLMTDANGDMTSWWNGLYIAVVKKGS